MTVRREKNSINHRQTMKMVWLLLASVLTVTTGQAPGDEQELCTVTLPSVGQNIVEDPLNSRILMDSSHYSRLLPPNTNPVWQGLDLDNNNNPQFVTNWVEQGGQCTSGVQVCGYNTGPQNNWLITQHINRTVDGVPLQQVTVQIEYQQTTCPDTGSNVCHRIFELQKYETSTINPAAARNITNYDLVVTLITQVGQETTTTTQNVDFSTNESGFYLAIRDPGTCILISRLIVFYYTCPADVVNLVQLPETIAPSIGSSQQLPVIPSCVDNASPVSRDFTVNCLERGIWSSVPSCACNSGFIQINDSCTPCDPGFYASMANGVCLVCPANSNSIQSGLAECPCDDGYHRTSQEVDLPCTLICPDLLTPTNGGITYSDIFPMSEGSIATYSCVSGYVLTFGDEVRTCTVNGWDGVAPNCTAICPELNLTAGDVIYSPNRWEGAVATHTCNPGYTLNGTVSRYCETDSMWSGSAPTCEPLLNGDLRLVSNSGTTGGSSGRLEVYYDSQWGTVCTDGFDDNDARVACRQLGYSSFTNYGRVDLLRFSEASSSTPTWLDNLACTGSESRLINCSVNPIRDENCSNSQDIGLICSTVGDLRLVSIFDTTGGSSGRLEVYYNGQWGTVCDDSFDGNDATVACGQLGYSSFTSYGSVGLLSFSPASFSTPIWLDNLACTGSESRLINCPANPIGDENCGHSEDIGLVCSNIFYGDLRLVNNFGTTRGSSGRLEVYYNDTWGTVCSDRFDDNDARVACRQLGYSSFTDYRSVDSLGFNQASFSTPIWLDNLACTGLENRLISCSANPIGDEDCSHSDDIGLICNTSSFVPEFGLNIGAIIGGSVTGIIILLLLVLCALILFACWRRRRKGGLKLGAENSVAMDTIREQQHSPKNTKKSQMSTLVDQIPNSLKIPSSCLKVGDHIGEGAFGIVYKGLLRDWSDIPVQGVAVKTLRGLFSPADIQDMVSEITKMQEFHHPHVMSLIGVCMDAGPGISMVMPFMANGSLLDYLKKNRNNLELTTGAENDQILSVKKLLLKMCHQIALGMAYLAEHKFIHRDLAARNCMLDSDGSIRVGDFGLAEDVYSTGYFRQQDRERVKLPYRWMALESLNDAIFSEKTDVWSYGVTVWEVFSGGRTPYPGVDPMSLVRLLRDGGRLETPNNAACSQEIAAVMVSCWYEHPDERPDFSQLSLEMDQLLNIMSDYIELKIENLVDSHGVDKDGYNYVLSPEEQVQQMATTNTTNNPAYNMDISEISITENSAYKSQLLATQEQAATVGGEQESLQESKRYIEPLTILFVK